MKLKDSANKESVKNKKIKTCEEKYGIKNPGVMGAYASKSAYLFIKKFIEDNNINDALCYYKGGGINGKEYYQMIYDDVKSKYIYVSYDFVLFKDDKLKEIDMVLEYNGPWHYTKEEVELDPKGNSSPYKNSKSKMEVYEFDIKKLSHIPASKKLIFWEKTKKMEIFKDPL